MSFGRLARVTLAMCQMRGKTVAVTTLAVTAARYNWPGTPRLARACGFESYPHGRLEPTGRLRPAPWRSQPAAAAAGFSSELPYAVPPCKLAD